MTIYDDIKEVALEVLTEFNQGVIELVKLTPGVGPDDNPGASSEIVYSLKATAKGVSFKYIKQGLAASADLEVTAAVLSDVVPSANDFIKIDSVKYKIVQFVPIPAAGTQVTWKFIVRKGG